jgi:hypothetical protein
MDILASPPVIWAALASASTWALTHWWHRRKLRASIARIAGLQVELDRLRAKPEDQRRVAIANGSPISVRNDIAITMNAAPITRSRRHRLLQAVRWRYFPLALRRRRGAREALAFLDTVASTRHSSGPSDLN